MMLTKVISTAVLKGRLIVKILGFGSSDVRTAYNILPFGIDSNINKNYRAIYADTEDNDKKVIIGVIAKNVLTAPGEIRLFSENASGAEVFWIHLKNNGTCELGGNSDNLSRHSVLEEQINQLKTDFNSFVAAFNQHVHPTAAPGAPSPPTAIPDSIPVSETSIDISAAKINNLLTS